MEFSEKYFTLMHKLPAANCQPLDSKNSFVKCHFPLNNLIKLLSAFISLFLRIKYCTIHDERINKKSPCKGIDLRY